MPSANQASTDSSETAYSWELLQFKCHKCGLNNSNRPSCEACDTEAPRAVLIEMERIKREDQKENLRILGKIALIAISVVAVFIWIFSLRDPEYEAQSRWHDAKERLEPLVREKTEAYMRGDMAEYNRLQAKDEALRKEIDQKWQELQNTQK